MFGYNLHTDGTIKECGTQGTFENYLNGSEPFTSFDIIKWRKVGQNWELIPVIYEIPENPGIESG